MRESRSSFALSAQQIDPLSWFTGPLVPLSLATMAALYGSVMIAVTWGQTVDPILQGLGLALCVGADVVVHLATRPLRRPIGWRIGALALLVSAAGMVLSAIGYAGTSFSVELWWAPIAFGLTVMTLSPYLPVRQLLVLGGGFTLAVVLASIVALWPVSGIWGTIGSAVIIAYPPVVALAATVTFSYFVVSTMLPLAESRSRILVAGQGVRDEAADILERATVARLTARAAPYLERIAEAGHIDPADRALAGQMARRLRDELVTQSNLSWLDSIASESRLVVVDPDRLARRMNNAQRTALRAMLRAILAIPETDTRSLMVELRKAPDGATAVGVSLDLALPEGTRIMHLAPYYLTLRTTARDLAFDRDKLSVTFTMEPGER
ncbi:MAG: hypothetical protein ABJA94_03165 [Rhodoglobus sp.]